MLARGGRRWDDIERGCLVLTAVLDDRAVVIDRTRRQVAWYLLFPGMEDLLVEHGLIDDAAPFRQARDRGDHAGAAAALGDRVVETLAIAGTASEVREKVQAWTEYVDLPILYPPTGRLSRDEILENQFAITAAFSRRPA